MPKVVDLSGELTGELSERLWEIEESNRADFVALIDSVSLQNLASVDWWASNAASKNVFTSPLYRNYCLTLLALSLLSQPAPPREIVVGSRQIAALLRPLGSRQGCRIRISEPPLRAIKGLIGSFIHIAGELVMRWRYRNRSARATPSAGHGILLETFLHETSFRDGVYFDRYFGDLPERIEQARPGELRIIFEPVGVRDYATFFATARQDRRFVIACDFLVLTDYLWVIATFLRIRFIRPPERTGAGLDWWPLIRAELRRESFHALPIKALLMHRLILRLAKCGFRFQRFVNWWENQWMDKTEQLAVRKAYPDARSIGYYCGAVHEEYLSSFPTPAEDAAGALPDLIVVTGRAWAALLKRYYPEARIGLWPAYRYSRLWSRTDEATERPAILVALPILNDEAKAILTAIADWMRSDPAAAGTSRVVVRPHPASRDLQLTLLDSLEWNDRPETDGGGELWLQLQNARALVTGWSSSAIEALAAGVPVILYPKPRSQRPLPAEVPTEMYRIAENQEALCTALREMTVANGERRRNLGEQIKAQFFEPPAGELPAFFA